MIDGRFIVSHVFLGFHPVTLSSKGHVNFVTDDLDMPPSYASHEAPFPLSIQETPVKFIMFLVIADWPSLQTHIELKLDFISGNPDL